MNIRNGWKFKDLVTGITFEATEGEHLDRIHLEGDFGNRDLFFAKDGKFDGTSSAVESLKDRGPIQGNQSEKEKS